MIFAARAFAQLGAGDFSAAAEAAAGTIVSVGNKGSAGEIASICGISAATTDSMTSGVTAGESGLATLGFVLAADIFAEADFTEVALVLAAGLGFTVSVLGFAAAFTGAFFLGAGFSVLSVSAAADLAAFFTAGLLASLAFLAAEATIALAAAAAVFFAAGFLGAAAAGALSGFTSSGVVMAKTPCYWLVLLELPIKLSDKSR